MRTTIIGCVWNQLGKTMLILLRRKTAIIFQVIWVMPEFKLWFSKILMHKLQDNKTHCIAKMLRLSVQRSRGLNWDKWECSAHSNAETWSIPAWRMLSRQHFADWETKSCLLIKASSGTDFSEGQHRLFCLPYLKMMMRNCWRADYKKWICCALNISRIHLQFFEHLTPPLLLLQSSLYSVVFCVLLPLTVLFMGKS